MLLALITPAVAFACPYPYGGASSANLRVNHGQLLATHNSYHIGTSFWDYTHPPLPQQLANGIRGFELDIYYDPAKKEFRVIHVVTADELTTCKTLDDCMLHVQAWRSQYPFHYPLFFQLELGGMLQPIPDDGIDVNACTYEDVRAASDCAASSCSDITPSEVSGCIIGKCYDILPSKSSCASMLFCLQSKFATFDAAHKFTGKEIISEVQACVGPTPGSHTEVELTTDEVQAAEIMEALEASVSKAFPISQRITPSDLITPTNDECVATSTSTCDTYIWPLVNESRGNAIFWLTQTPAGWPSSSSSSGFFVDSDVGNGPIMKADDVRSFGQQEMRSLLDKGYWLRSRADNEDGHNSGKRDDTVNWGASTVSTDYPPKNASSGGLGGEYPWSTTVAWPENGDMVLKGGSPVRCNAALLASDALAAVECTALALEDPAFLKCEDPNESLNVVNSSVTTQFSLAFFGMLLLFNVAVFTV